MYRLLSVDLLNLWLAIADKQGATLQEFLESFNTTVALGRDQFFDVVMCKDCKYYDSDSYFCKYWNTHNHSSVDFCSRGDDIASILS